MYSQTVYVEVTDGVECEEGSCDPEERGIEQTTAPILHLH